MPKRNGNRSTAPAFGHCAMRVVCVLLATVVVVGCDRSVADGVRDDRELRDRVARVVPSGTDATLATATMQRNGFACTFHRGIDVDTLAKDESAPPPDRLTCIKDEPAPETSDGYRRHFVDILLNGSHVTAIDARSRIDRIVDRKP